MKHIMLPGFLGERIGQQFATAFNVEDWGVTKKQESILLEGPDHPEYRGTWKQVLQTARCKVSEKVSLKLVMISGDLCFEEVEC